ncbi:prolyl oligopeptidase family serine peptidase [Flavobacterium sp. ANB]|uniref:prolyl oligopeptidase family serine peptidase n=1 Tax=unclassified Flavobacterium TaxID=196869 RepID=UPI0012B84459|nr:MULTISPECIES: prolyl oligopeptidase family serine peptidase [unclassified Flavobacterium]MBF4519151.1 prolyl oligopeptidase family serine peptidase [Flavobacterium sp. ANB]MTD71649.1 prolyl oligopeptidase family serine peptidase [Flavobacterium sp. LC2016-13]
MKKKFLIKLLFLFSFVLSGTAQELMTNPKTNNTANLSVMDDFQYLENLQNDSVQKWFREHNDRARLVLNNISGRNELVAQFIEFEKRKSFNVALLTVTENNTFYYLKKSVTDKSDKLYCKKQGKEEILLFDSSSYKPAAGQTYVISYLKPSWDENKIAISLTKNGEEIAEIVFLDLESRTLLPTVISNCWPSELGGINWLPDSSGIIYVHIPITDTKSADYLLDTESVIYRIGDHPSKHIVIFSKKNNPEMKIARADFPFIKKINLKDKYILASLSGAAIYLDYYYTPFSNLLNEKINWKPLYKKSDGLLDPIVVNDDLYCISSHNASNYKIIRTKISAPDLKNPEIIVQEDPKETIDEFVVNTDGVYYTTKKNGVEANLYLKRNNKIKKLELPVQAGNIILSSNNKYGNDLLITTSGWLDPNRRFSYNADNNQFIEDTTSPVATYPEFKDFIVKEIEISSHDGVLVPVSLIFSKNIKRDRKNYIMMDGYGSYGISKNPRFQPIILSWVMNGGIYVIPHVRGGGEKGDGWHESGFKKNKPNTWKDLIATAEYLIRDNITTSDRIGILSGSAGGILVGRAMTARPDLFKVMVCYDGYLNPLRIDKAPNGPNNMKELGDPGNKEELAMLAEIDSFQHLQKGIHYPACLISVGMNDARVAPWMSAKFVAKLETFTASKNETLFAVSYDTGHGIKNSNLQLYNDYADEFAFAFWQMGHPKFKLNK